MKKAIIVAKDLNGAIGKNGQLPWKIKEDMRIFKSITEGSTVVMGRKTFDSIGKPLKNRHNIVISRDKNLKIENAIVCGSLQAAIDIAESLSEDIYFIGGGEIYKEAIDCCDVIFLSVVDTKISDADAFFPELNSDWVETSSRIYDSSEDNEFSFEFKIFEHIYR